MCALSSSWWRAQIYLTRIDRWLLWPAPTLYYVQNSLHEFWESTWEFPSYQQGQVISISLYLQAFYLAILWTPLVSIHPCPAVCLGHHNMPTSKRSMDLSYHTFLCPMLLIHLACVLKGGVIRCALSVQKGSQSYKSILKCPLNLINKTRKLFPWVDVPALCACWWQSSEYPTKSQPLIQLST